MADEAELRCLIKRLEEIVKQQRGIQAVTQFPRNWRKRDILRQAREWGWEIVQRNARHSTKAVRGNLRISIPGHGDGDTLKVGSAHKILTELAEPVLRELQLQQQECINLLISFLARGISFSSSGEADLLARRIGFLEEQNKKLELKIVETEEAALSLLTEKELENQWLANKVRELAEEQLQAQEILGRAIVVLKKLRHLFDQLQNVVNQLPILRVRSSLQGYLNNIQSIFETSLLPAGSGKLLQENEQEPYQGKLLQENNHGSHRES
jgi:hypothetical protein